MSNFVWIVVIALLICLIFTLGILVRESVLLCRYGDDPMARFKYGYQGAFALMGVLWCCLVLSALLATCTPTTTAIVAAIVVNLVAQPIALCCLNMGARKIGWGLVGRVYYAGRLVSENHFNDMNKFKRVGFVAHSIFGGVVILAMGSIIGVGCGWPLVWWTLS